MSADYLTRLAGRVAGARLETLAASTVAAARRVVLDTLGAMLAGSRLPEHAALARLAAGRAPGPARLVGHGLTAEPMFAALANATAGVALEVDEGNRWGGGHPAIHVLPAALAVAEERRLSGARLVEALVAGYEVASRLGSATIRRPNVHSHGTWGTPGAAAAVARLEGLDAGATRTAISLAASMSPANSWTPCFEGATIRNLYPGRSSFQGILAVHLLACGFTALADGPGDVYGTVLGEAFEPARVVAGLGDAWRIEANYFKLHACCYYNHPALDAVARLAAEHRFTADDVEQIGVTTIPFADRMAYREPGSMLAAKFSIPYAVAARLVTGAAGVAAFADAARSDPRILTLAERVEVTGDAGMALDTPGRPAAEVRIGLRDGRTLAASTSVVRGDAADPAPDAELEEKFLALAGPALGAAGARRVAASVADLERLPDVSELTAHLAPGG